MGELKVQAPLGKEVFTTFDDQIDPFLLQSHTLAMSGKICAAGKFSPTTTVFGLSVKLTSRKK